MKKSCSDKDIRLLPTMIKISRDQLIKMYNDIKSDSNNNTSINVIDDIIQKEALRVRKGRSKINSHVKKVNAVSDMIDKIARKTRTTLINNATKAELKFKDLLDSCDIKYEFQKIFHIHDHDRKFFVVDFYIPSKKVAIELDGNHHYEGVQLYMDKERDMMMRNIHGIETVRIKNKVVMNKSKCIDVISSVLIDSSTLL